MGVGGEAEGVPFNRARAWGRVRDLEPQFLHYRRGTAVTIQATL